MSSALLKREKVCSLVLFALALILLYCPCFAQEKVDEETYSISLVQTAEVDREIHELGDKKVLAETYTVEEGDHLWQVLREMGLLEKRNLAELLAVLKKLNSSLSDLNLIHPGEKIVIPLTIAPIGGPTARSSKLPLVTVPLEKIKGLDLEQYTIRPGDSLVKVVESLYKIPEGYLYDEYLNLLKELNPDIVDLNRVYPGQKVRLPIYSPKVVRMPITPAPPAMETDDEVPREILGEMGRQLGEIFSQMGEEWVQTGKHFIPLKSGGQINLKADSYPVIDLRSGNRVIVDLYNDLPERMAALIRSSWANYRIVHLDGDGDLRKAVDRILPLCEYPELLGADEPFVLGGDIPLRITADWIIKLPPGTSDGKGEIIVLNLFGEDTPRISGTVRAFLGSLGIRSIDYPVVKEAADESDRKPADESLADMEPLEPDDNTSSLVEMLLDLVGQEFSGNVEIPIYHSEKSDFNLVVKADFLLNVGGRDCVIDMSGLGSDIIGLLKEHQFLVLLLSGMKESSVITAKILEFVGIEFDHSPHPFWAAPRDGSKNIQLMIPGISFLDSEGRKILSTHLRFPPAIAGFLTQKGYRLLYLPGK